MSFPVQVLVVGDELRPAVEAVCRRLGATEAARVAYPIPFDDQPDLGARLTKAVDAMLEEQGGRGEGGWGRVVLAPSAQAFARAAEELPAKRGWLSVGIVLAEPGEVDVPDTRFDTLHLIPTAVGARRLVAPDRIQVAVNLLGVVLELARGREARVTVRDWLATYPGVFTSVAQVTRFNSPAVQRILANRLAAAVASRMVVSLREPTEQAPPELTPPRSGLVTAELLERARELGQELAAEIAGSEPDEVLDEELVTRRAEAAVKELPQRVSDVIEKLGQDSMVRATSWLKELRQEVDGGLAAGTFTAIEPLRGALEACRLEVERRIAALETNGGGAPGPAVIPSPTTDLRPPSAEPVRQAAERLEKARRDDEASGYLVAGWSLVLAVLAALTLSPWLGLADETKAGEALAMILPGGVFAAAALTVLAVAGVVGLVRRQARRRKLERLETVANDAFEAYRDAWASALADEVKVVGEFLEARVLRFLLTGLVAERDRLATIAGAVVRLEARFRHDSAVPRPSARTFDGYVVLSDELFDAAALSAPPEELYRRAEASLADSEWRRELPFLDGDAFLEGCGEEFAEFSHQLPLRTREDLRASVVAPSRQAIREMVENLGRFIGRGEAAARFLILPEALREALPDDLDAATEVWPGVSDLFHVVARPVS